MVLELLGDVPWSRSRDFNPGLGKDGAGSDDKGNVDDSVEWVRQGSLERVRGGDVVRDTGNSRQLGWDVLKWLDMLAFGARK